MESIDIERRFFMKSGSRDLDVRNFLSSVLNDATVFDNIRVDDRRDGSRLLDDNPMKENDLFVEGRILGDDTWNTAFLHSAVDGPEGLGDAWKQIMDGSRSQRFLNGFYTYKEIQAIENAIHARMTGPDALNVVDDKGRILGQDEVLKRFRSSVRAIRGCPGGELELDGRFPNLELLVGNAKVLDSGAARNLRHVYGNLDVYTPGCTMYTLVGVQGNLHSDFALRAESLTKVGGSLDIVGNGTYMSSLKSVGGKVKVEGGIGSLPEGTRDRVRSAKVRSTYENLFRKPSMEKGFDRQVSPGVSSMKR